MSKEQDGGPAFPDQGQRMEGNGQWNQQWSSGMSLRDWFAGQALVGLTANLTLRDYLSETASRAYALADAMLEARKK